jgi:hypothetical protein
MTTSEVLSERALELASAGTVDEEAVVELLVTSGDHRVAVVRARQSLIARSADSEEDRAMAEAVRLLDAVLTRMPV